MVYVLCFNYCDVAISCKTAVGRQRTKCTIYLWNVYLKYLRQKVTIYFFKFEDNLNIV